MTGNFGKPRRLREGAPLVVAEMRRLVRDESLNLTNLNINDIVEEVAGLIRLDLERAHVSLRLELEQICRR